ncbi:MAG: prevent-host-death family protein [Pseudomonas sp.]|nr:prevent-host-death family protein [Pseudomonas sp.]
MLIVNIHEAQIHLSRLVDQAVRGEPFIISRAGKPLVKVMAMNLPQCGQVKRLGFMAGQIKVPEDFDRMHGDEIGEMFSGDECHDLRV